MRQGLFRALFLSVLCVCAAGARAVTVTFPDANLEAAIRAAFTALGTPLGATIDSTNLADASFTSLDASNRGITNLAGLEYCTSLVSLDLSRNAITSISQVVSLTALLHLDLGYGDPLATGGTFPPTVANGNNITDISPIAGLTGLVYLNVGGNPSLTNISAIGGLTSLQTLWLGFQNIASFSPIANLSSLQILGLRSCTMSDADLGFASSLTSLFGVDVGKNQLTTLDPLAGNTGIQLLVASENQLTDISALAGFTAMDTLLLNSNLLTEVQPLVDNTGIAGADSIVLSGNTLTNDSLCNQIPVIQARITTGTLVVDGACGTVEVLTMNVVGTGNTTPAVGPTNYNTGDIAEISASPIAGSGYAFKEWQGDAAGSSPVTNVVMNANKNVTAVFVTPGDFTLTINKTGAGTGTISPGTGSFAYLNGTFALAYAFPDSGMYFGGWTGAVTSIDYAIPVVMDANKSLTANFATSGFDLTMAVSGNGKTDPGAGTYPIATGTVVSLTATPAAGYLFSQWQGDLGGASATSPTISVTMNQARSLTAVFTLDPNAKVLTINVDGTGSSTPPPGDTAYTNGATAEVSALAQPGSGFAFDHWSGANTSTDEFINVLMDTNKTLTAVYTSPAPYTLNLTTSGVSGNTYPLIGVISYLAGRTAFIAAIIPSGTYFGGWSGDLTGYNPFKNLLMNGNKTVNADFQSSGFNLSVESIDQGSTDPPTGVYPIATNGQVTVTAIPDKHNRFDYWSGDLGGASVNANPITVTMNQARSLQAHFVFVNEAYLTLLSNGPGSTTSGNGTLLYAVGQVVSFSAVPARGAPFLRWEGDLDGNSPTASSVVLTMNDDHTITGFFQQNTYSLDLAVSGPGSTNPGPGTYSFPATGQVTTVTAVPTPGSGYVFGRWDGNIGAANPTNPSLTLTMDQHRYVTAIFVPAGGGEGEGEGEGEGQGTDCTLSPVADGGFEVSGSWTQSATQGGLLPQCDTTNCVLPAGQGPRSGNGWAIFRGGTDAQAVYQASVGQFITIPKAQRAILHFYVKTVKHAGSPLDSFRLYVDEGLHRFGIDNTDTDYFGKYQRVDLDISDKADGFGHSIRFASAIYGNDQSLYTLDDVCLEIQGVGEGEGEGEGSAEGEGEGEGEGSAEGEGEGEGSGEGEGEGEGQPACPETACLTLSTDAAGYCPGDDVLLRVAMDYYFSTPLLALGFDMNLPAGWSFVQVNSGAPLIPTVQPAAGATGGLHFAWGQVPSLPIEVTLTMRPNFRVTGAVDFVAHGVFDLASDRD